MYDKTQHNVLDIIESIAAVGGKNDKLAILSKHKDNDDLKKSFALALNGLISFYIKKIPEAEFHKSEIPLSEALDGLNLLANRTYTGNAAAAYVKNILEFCSEKDAEVIRRVLGRDLRCGASDGSVEKTWPGLVPKFAVMLATSYSKKALANIKYPAYAQLKADGARCEAIIDVDGGVVTFYSRNGKEMLLSPATGARLLEGFRASEMTGKWVVDGEMLYINDDGLADRQTGNGIVNKAVKGTLEWEQEKHLHYVLWDLIPYADFQAGKGKTSYEIRLGQLNQIKVSPFFSVIPTFTVDDIDEAREIYGKYIEEGLEGIILKNKSMIWEDTRSKGQVKFKQELVADLEIIDILPGKAGKKYENVCGAVTMATKCRKLMVNVSGMSDDLRNWLMTNQTDAIGTIWEVTYNGIVKAKNSDIYKLFLPRLGIQRHDKNEANTLEELQEAQTEASL